MPTESAAAALRILRDPGQFQWSVIPLFALVVYVYAVEVERRNWRQVHAGLAFLGLDGFAEIVNALVLHFTGHAPLWGAPGRTAFLILVGLNLEICLMFAILGVVFCKLLPRDPHRRVLGLPNRLVVALAGSGFCLCVELMLNAAGALTWDWPWWSARAPWSIFLGAYLPFFILGFWVHDLPEARQQAWAVGLVFAVDLAGILVFGWALGWI